jgi:hypothetical protein
LGREKLLSLLFRRLNKQPCSATNRSHSTEQMSASLHVLTSKSRLQIHPEIRFFRVKTSIIVYLSYYVNYCKNILLPCEIGVMIFFRDSGQAIIPDVVHLPSLQRNKMEERTYNAALGLVQLFASWHLRRWSQYLTHVGYKFCCSHLHVY